MNVKPLTNEEREIFWGSVPMGNREDLKALLRKHPMLPVGQHPSQEEYDVLLVKRYEAKGFKRLAA